MKRKRGINTDNCKWKNEIIFYRSFKHDDDDDVFI